MRSLMADTGIWPVLIFWVVFVMIGKMAQANKKRASQAGTGDRGPGTEKAAQPGLLSELKRAMEELKRAEQEQRAGLQGTAQQPRAGLQGAAQQPRDEAQRRKAREYLEVQKQRAAQKRAAVARRSQRPVARLELPDAEEMSSEDAVVSLKGRDYDDEAESIIKTRRAAAERRGRDEASGEDMSELQRARRASRPDVAIGSRAEHDEWHQQLDTAAKPAAGKAAARGPLARFADGSLRSAVVLGEIFGQPGGRQQNG